MDKLISIRNKWDTYQELHDKASFETHKSLLVLQHQLKNGRLPSDVKQDIYGLMIATGGYSAETIAHFGDLEQLSTQALIDVSLEEVNWKLIGVTAAAIAGIAALIAGAVVLIRKYKKKSEEDGQLLLLS